ncbi:potassium channel subfamily K member 9-like [Anneissia japonica]|uniref:potassium channel subfamily K member 9-like n=1 Tax=Anneissia japonica TaxID=1529436 RepID=UPI00142597B8|nr:potassium channel subfamily K member 9-like [Anneissia japonica]
MKKQNFRTLFLIIATFMYLLFGAAVFDAMEAKKEEHMNDSLSRREEHIKHKYNVSDEDMANLTTIILLLKPHRAGVQWKFAGSFYFCMTVITTIGYGHSAPRTDGGRVFCMMYAVCGIPLNLVMFQSVGERLNVFMAFVVKRLKRLLGFHNDDVSHTELVMLGGFMSISATFLGAFAFAKFEGWNFLEAYYYVFITLTTVGFGDYVALQKDNDLQDNASYVAFSILYILIALVIVASVMNLLVLRLLTLNTEDERREQEENQLQQRSHSFEMNHLHDNDMERTYVDHCNSHRNNINRTTYSTEKDFRAFCTCSCLKKNSNHSRTNCGTYLPHNTIQNSLPLRHSQYNHFNDDDEMLVQFRESGRSSNRASI